MYISLRVRGPHDEDDRATTLHADGDHLTVLGVLPHMHKVRLAHAEDADALREWIDRQFPPKRYPVTERQRHTARDAALTGLRAITDWCRSPPNEDATKSVMRHAAALFRIIAQELVP